MQVSEALKESSIRDLNVEDVGVMLAACQETPRAALDRMAIELATAFVLGSAEFREADDLANVMFAYAARNDVLGDVLHKVFLAFDAGEFIPPGSPATTDPVALYTRPQLAKLLTSIVAT